jgi:hypothetical protein
MGVVKTGIITGSIRIAHSRELKTSATIRKENRILILMTVSVQSDLRVLNAGISHGVILRMEIMKRKSGKNETGRGGDHDNRECSPASTVKEYLTIRTKYPMGSRN